MSGPPDSLAGRALNLINNHDPRLPNAMVLFDPIWDAQNGLRANALSFGESQRLSIGVRALELDAEDLGYYLLHEIDHARSAHDLKRGIYRPYYGSIHAPASGQLKGHPMYPHLLAVEEASLTYFSELSLTPWLYRQELAAENILQSGRAIRAAIAESLARLRAPGAHRYVSSHLNIQFGQVEYTITLSGAGPSGAGRFVLYPISSGTKPPSVVYGDLILYLQEMDADLAGKIQVAQGVQERLNALKHPIPTARSD